MVVVVDVVAVVVVAAAAAASVVVVAVYVVTFIEKVIVVFIVLVAINSRLWCNRMLKSKEKRNGDNRSNGSSGKQKHLHHDSPNSAISTTYIIPTPP